MRIAPCSAGDSEGGRIRCHRGHPPPPKNHLTIRRKYAIMPGVERAGSRYPRSRRGLTAATPTDRAEYPVCLACNSETKENTAHLFHQPARYRLRYGIPVLGHRVVRVRCA